MNARIDDITPKSDEELTALRSLGVTELYIGQESGDDATLTLVGKGITAADIRRECRRLEKRGFSIGPPSSMVSQTAVSATNTR